MLIGLNDKLQVFNDFQQDVANHKIMLKQSEDVRANWQVEVRKIASKVIVDSEQHTK